MGRVGFVGSGTGRVMAIFLCIFSFFVFCCIFVFHFQMHRSIQVGDFKINIQIQDFVILALYMRFLVLSLACFILPCMFINRQPSTVNRQPPRKQTTGSSNPVYNPAQLGVAQYTCIPSIKLQYMRDRTDVNKVRPLHCTVAKPYSQSFRTSPTVYTNILHIPQSPNHQSQITHHIKSHHTSQS